MTYKTAGPCENWCENISMNSTSFGSSVSDDWLYTAKQGYTPARLTHTQDSTSYATIPSEDGWIDARYYGTQSPAKVAAGATGSFRGGSTT